MAIHNDRQTNEEHEATRAILGATTIVNQCTYSIQQSIVEARRNEQEAMEQLLEVEHAEQSEDMESAVRAVELAEVAAQAAEQIVANMEEMMARMMEAAGPVLG